ncbi:MAG TPA: transcriptional repressor LexA [Candidatus Limiplasma sp.]|nr:transcriptional repressor LexA [Candidatus Limiplasma sp.]HRX09543.1 transcriptional repressor LexA [Candidatus Limiplasma sp.]
MSNPRGESQEKIFAYINKVVKAKGYPPSVREICEATGLRSTSTVHAHLKRLERRGMISRDSMKPRAISLPHNMQPIDTVTVPVVGRVTAGTPILASENIEEYISIPNVLLGDGEHYILGVRGESMIEAGINDGDFVVVKKQQDANNGDIVVAMIDDEATVKRFYRENGHIRLQPENSTMSPILSKHVTILGKVVSLYRLY